MQIKFYATIEPLFVISHNAERGWKHGIEETVLKFEYMIFTINGVLMARRVMDLDRVVDLLDKKLFSCTLLLPTPASFLSYDD